MVDKESAADTMKERKRETERGRIYVFVFFTLSTIDEWSCQCIISLV